MDHTPAVTSFLKLADPGARPGRGEEGAITVRARGDDAEAIERLVLANLPFVIHVAKEFRGRGVPFEDLLSEGCVGLLKAIRRFDPATGTRFMTYASFWVRKAIFQALVDQSRTVRVPRYAREQGRMAPRELRIDAEVPGFGEVTFAERLADRSRPGPAESLISRQERRRLRGHILALPHREQAVIASRFGLLGEPALTLNEVGRRLGISRERVRQIEVAALKRLRSGFLRSPVRA
jgi:RNA polymerase primary sigma factor